MSVDPIDVFETALSVSDLTARIQTLLEGDRQLRQVWLRGEVSSLKDHPRGLFFTLSDPQGGAAIQCVAWNSHRSRLRQPPKLGAQLLVLGRIAVYPRRGEYKLVAWQTLAAGEGLQALHYRQLRGRLEAEGLFDPARKRPLPPHPQVVAVVTSPTAAAWGDIQRTLERRYPGLHVLLSPATVQGSQAPPSLVAAIDRVNRDGRADVLILARGGGAVEDLSCFNDEGLVRAIAASAIPVIAGIGHQRDESLADLAADFSAHTPTAAAEIAVPSYAQLLLGHQERIGRSIASLQRRCQRESEALRQWQTRLRRFPDTSRQLLQATAGCHLLKEKLSALDPNAVLARGYAVVRREGETIVRSPEGLVPEQELTVQLARGTLKVKITEILS